MYVSPRYIKTDSPGAHCPYCPPFFLKVVPWLGHAPPRRANGADARVAMTRQNVTGAIKSAMEMLCVDSRKFSGKSMRRSGLSAAMIQSMLAMRRDRLLFGPARRRGARQSTTLQHPHTALGREKAFSLWSSA